MIELNKLHLTLLVFCLVPNHITTEKVDSPSGLDDTQRIIEAHNQIERVQTRWLPVKEGENNSKTIRLKEEQGLHSRASQVWVTTNSSN